MQTIVTSDTKILRIMDVNLNRLREALRVIEEYFRFLSLDERVSVELKTHRHSLEGIECEFGAEALVKSRDIAADPFAFVTRPEEMERSTPSQILCASFKRAQEACRVLEEYAKVSNHPSASGKAKALRFSLYTLEKQIVEQTTNE